MRAHLVVATCALLAVGCTTDDSAVEPPATERTAPTSTASGEGASIATDQELAGSAVAAPAEAETSAVETEGCPIVRVIFNEGAPRDRVTIENSVESTASVTSVLIDLAPSTGRLIFDTTEGGSGVEVFQDFRVEEGSAELEVIPQPVDGDEQIELEFARFEPGERFIFSIDVDDRLDNSDLGQIQVTGAEIAGASVKISSSQSSQTVVFDADSAAQTDCS